MLLFATTQASCRRCGTPIAKGEQVSWVQGQDLAGTVGPYHLDCTPLAEDVSIARISAAAAAKTEEELAKSADDPSAEGTSGTHLRKRERSRLLVGSVLVASVLLAVSATSRLPYEFYMLLRVVVSFTSTLLAIEFWRHPQNGWRLGLIAFAALYNPLLPIHLSRSLWVPINICTAVALGAALYALLHHPRPTNSGA